MHIVIDSLQTPRAIYFPSLTQRPTSFGASHMTARKTVGSASIAYTWGTAQRTGQFQGNTVKIFLNTTTCHWETIVKSGYKNLWRGSYSWRLTLSFIVPLSSALCSIRCSVIWRNCIYDLMFAPINTSVTQRLPKVKELIQQQTQFNIKQHLHQRDYVSAETQGSAVHFGQMRAKMADCFWKTCCVLWCTGEASPVKREGETWEKWRNPPFSYHRSMKGQSCLMQQQGRTT